MKKFKDILRFFYYFLVCVAWVIGLIAGVGYSIHLKSPWVVTVSIAALAAMAFPYVLKCVKDSGFYSGAQEPREGR